MKDSIEKFLLFLEGRNSSIHTLRAYRKSLNEFSAHVGNLPVNELKRQHVRSFVRYVGERGLKRTSTHRMVASVKSFVKWLHVEDLIPARHWTWCDYTETPPSIDRSAFPGGDSYSAGWRIKDSVS